MREQSFEELLSGLLTDFKNQFDDPDSVDISEGSMPFIRYAATASALWGIQSYASYVKSQYLPDRCDMDMLYRWATIKNLPLVPNETEDDFRTRVLADFADPPAGGKLSDWEDWAKLYTMPYTMIPIQSTQLTLYAGPTGTFDQLRCVDGELTYTTWGTNGWIPGYRVVVDFESAVDSRMVMLYMSAAGSDIQYDVQYSDDCTSWTSVAILTAEYAKWNKIEWASAGEHRYWQIRCRNNPSDGPVVTEMEWYATGLEKVIYAKAISGGQGGGSVDVYVLSDRSGEVPSNGLLVKLMEHFDTCRNATSRWRRALAPEIVPVTVVMSSVGDLANKNTAKTEMTSLINGLTLAEPLYVAQLLAIAINNKLSNPVVSQPGGDLVPTDYQLLRVANVTIA